MHIATRGRLDGEYGIATRGYVICPDIVARFPELAEISSRAPLGLVLPGSLQAEIVAQHAQAILGQPEISANLDLPRLAVELVEHGLGAELAASRFLAVVLSEDLAAELRAEIGVGEVGEDGLQGMLALEVLVGVVDDEPPHC